MKLEVAFVEYEIFGVLLTTFFIVALESIGLSALKYEGLVGNWLGITEECILVFISGVEIAEVKKRA